MALKISREEALEMIKDSSKFDHLIRVSRSMLNLADYFEQDKDEWELVGLLHDYDFDITEDNREIHGVLTAEVLEGKLSDEALSAIRSHDYRTGYEPETLLSKILISVDAFDIFLEMINDEKLDVNILKEKIRKWELPKPWLKELILNVEDCKITLDLFLELCLITLKD